MVVLGDKTVERDTRSNIVGAFPVGPFGIVGVDTYCSVTARSGQGCLELIDPELPVRLYVGHAVHNIDTS